MEHTRSIPRSIEEKWNHPMVVYTPPPFFACQRIRQQLLFNSRPVRWSDADIDFAFRLGVIKTGKATLQSFEKKLFSSPSVGVLSRNIRNMHERNMHEVDFGLEPLHVVYLYML